MTRGLIAAAEAAARDAGASRVRRVRVRVGALSGITPGHLREHYDAAVTGTALEGSYLEIEPVPEGIAALDDLHAQGVLLVGIDVEDA